MPGKHTKISTYADELMSTPRAHLRLELHQDNDGLKLTYNNRVIVECRLTREGMAAAGYMARALGVKIPPLGSASTARVSTGVMFRAVSIASLDFNNDESFVLLDRWIEEADMQRRGSSDAS